MADNQPQPPPGFQRPGIPGAGNILDPAVRGELREKLHEAVHDAIPHAAPAQGEAEETAPAPAGPPAAPGGAPQPGYRAGPFPHGDVDLRGFAANVPPGPVRPRRARVGRQFYFLPGGAAAADAPPPPVPAPRPAGPRPG